MPRAKQEYNKPIHTNISEETHCKFMEILENRAAETGINISKGDLARVAINEFVDKYYKPKTVVKK